MLVLPERARVAKGLAAVAALVRALLDRRDVADEAVGAVVHLHDVDDRRRLHRRRAQPVPVAAVDLDAHASLRLEKVELVVAHFVEPLALAQVPRELRLRLRVLVEEAPDVPW